MNIILIIKLHLQNHSDWSSMTPIIAIIISIIALFVNSRLARRNLRLNIQQLIFKTVNEKAKDCNSLWENEPVSEKINNNSPHFKVISEIIITLETIDKTFGLFEKNYKSIRNDRDYYYYLFWKQLRTDLRGWIRRSPEIAKEMKNEIYSNQINGIYETFSKYFE